MDASVNLPELIQALRDSEVFRNKCRIRPMTETFEELSRTFGIRNGDDAAAIPDGDGFLLLAAEGITASIVRNNPYLAGKCAVLANVNDIYAMGGYPLAMVDVIGTPDGPSAREICRGMRDNAARYQVPVVGGHLLRTSKDASVALAILGRAKQCITSFDACPGDRLVLVTRPNGRWLADMGFWNCTLPEDDARLVADLKLLPLCAERNLVRAGKDVSMAGISGTALMLAESSKVGVALDLDRLQPPPGVALPSWLLAFMSYGFLLAVHPDRLADLTALFQGQGLHASAIGAFHEERRAWLCQETRQAVLWDFEKQPFVGEPA